MLAGLINDATVSTIEVGYFGMKGLFLTDTVGRTDGLLVGLREGVLVGRLDGSGVGSFVTCAFDGDKV